MGKSGAHCSAEEAGKAVVCKYDSFPCDRWTSGHSGVCLLISHGEVLYVCVRVRFKGSNSVIDRGVGMTIREKLMRQGLVPSA